MADQLGPAGDKIMTLVYEYALARILQNVSVPTKSQRNNEFCVASHDRARQESDRLEAELYRAIAALEHAAGVTGSNPPAVEQ